MEIWNKLQESAPHVAARVRAAIMLFALVGVAEAHNIADALVWPGSEVWLRRLGVICAGIALLVRAGDKTQEQIKALAARIGDDAPASPPRPTAGAGTALLLLLALGSGACHLTHAQQAQLRAGEAECVIHVYGDAIEALPTRMLAIAQDKTLAPADAEAQLRAELSALVEALGDFDRAKREFACAAAVALNVLLHPPPDPPPGDPPAETVTVASRTLREPEGLRRARFARALAAAP